MSPAERDRAVTRLRTMTVGTTLAGIAAVGGFGAIAAVSYHGTTTEVVTAAVTTDQTTTDGSTTTGAATASPAATAALSVTAAPTVTSTSSTAHASTGGS